MVATTTRAIIGGTGTEAWTEATLLETRTIVTRYGRASAPAQHLSVAGERCWMLSRHGAGHDVAPHRINYRANIQALADLGVEEIVALNAVGIIDTEVQCGGLVMPEQLIDYTWGRHSTFADGVSAPLQHIAFDPPYTPGLRAALISAASAAGMPVIATGVMG
ncbi:MAG: 5'-methylthioadenosine phosphorylase, partial [Pseudomonadota bacterium]